MHFFENRGIFLGAATAHGAFQLRSVIKEALAVARKEDQRVCFTFNGVTVMLERKSNPQHIYRDVDRANRGYILGPVGPFPEQALTQQELDNDTFLANRLEPIVASA